uniref:Uncharacterized protein n=1 Tax=Rhizophora mucronata TaxID=61149 RepID=A0A2P2PBN7_RHIMU
MLSSLFFVCMIEFYLLMFFPFFWLPPLIVLSFGQLYHFQISLAAISTEL